MIVQNYQDGDDEFWQFVVVPDRMIRSDEHLAVVSGFTTKKEAQEKSILAVIKWAEELIENLKNLEHSKGTYHGV